ncbi:MAG: flagellar assembly protein FliW [Candidatus Krumholzibacteriota bacterium]|nr:flagellar assembly protein FliW [Candidatus Krumholzibacteriota bacterium]
MELIGTRFGDFHYEDKDLLRLPEGLVGMPQLTRFLILDFEADLPLKWLQSIEEPAMGFLVADPRLFQPDYSLHLSRCDLGDIAVMDPADLVVFVLCTYKGELEETTGNLLGPIVVHAESRVGRQIILEDRDLSTKVPLFIADAATTGGSRQAVAEPRG